MGFNTFNYGDVVQTGEAIKGARLKNSMLEQESDPNSVTNQQRQATLDLTKTQQGMAQHNFNETQQLDNSRFALSAFEQMAMDPTTAAQIYPKLKERGILPEEADYTQFDPAKIQQDSAASAERMRASLSAYAPQQQPEQTPNTLREYLMARDQGLLPEGMKYDEFKRAGKGPLVQIGTDGSQQGVSPDAAAGAEAAGIPSPVAGNPWDHIQDPKKRDDMRIKTYTAANTRFAALSERADKAEQFVQDIDRFLFLNKTNYTGAGMMIPGAKTLRKGVDPEFGEMYSISSKLTPQMRQGMPGAASDRDVTMFRDATVGAEQDPAANENIGLGLKIANENTIGKADFMRKYIDQWKHDDGAEQLWKDYLTNNPIFDHQAEAGSYKLNAKRVTPEEYFYPDKKKDVDDPLGILTDEEKARLRQ